MGSLGDNYESEVLMNGICAPIKETLEQESPTFLAPGTGFVEDSFSTDRGGGGWFRRCEG